MDRQGDGGLSPFASSFPRAIRALLQNAHKPSREGVESVGVEQEVAHAQKRHEDEQSINPVFDGWPQFGHRAEYDRIGHPRKPKLLERDVFRQSYTSSWPDLFHGFV
jgi:hypothetical protein